MTSLTILVIGLAVGSFLIASSCLFLVRCECTVIAKVGRRLFIVALLTLGGVGMAAALARHEGLAPLGLLAGLLIVAMLWESPAASTDQQSIS